MVTWAVLICGFVFALVVVGVRFWLLPDIANYRETVARELSDATRQRITIGNLAGRWSGFNLQLTLGDLEVFDRAGQSALRLDRVDSTLSWWSLVHWEPRFDSIEIERPDLNVKRDARGVVSVAGIEISDSTDGGGLSDWLLRQDEIVIRNAAITWRDEMSGAPDLALKEVNFRLENDGSHHRFGLRARPPEEIATPLDLRGDLTGRTVKDLAQWNGRLFAQLDFTDIAAWRTWVKLPIYVPHGLGAVRVWSGLKDGELADVLADVQLSQVVARLGNDLPELELSALKGRIGWKQTDGGFQVSTSKLGMSTHSYTLQPTDLTLRYRKGGAGSPPRGELQANALDFEPLVALADHLPFEPELRKELSSYAPRGSLYDLAVTWYGTWPQLQQHSVKARFVNLGVNAVGRVPGFAGVSGNIDSSERGGTLSLDAKKVVIDVPLLFRDKLAFDALTAQAGWAPKNDQYEFKFDNISFSNPGIAGSLFGTYQTVADARGIVDLSGHVSRAEILGIGRYIPLQLAERGRNWIEAAFQGGVASEIKVRIKGNLKDFPFPENKGGLFEVTARFAGGVLDYAYGWPKMENVEGNLKLHGRRMDATARDASILGARLARVRAEVPDLGSPERTLNLSGEAEGPTGEFLKFIDQSPVADLVDRFTTGVQAEGRGKLALKLALPLGSAKDTKVDGSYQFVNNQILNPGDPFPYEQVNGRLEFTDSSVRVPGATMTILGGPATLSGATQRDGTIRLAMAGRVNSDDLHRTNTTIWAQALRGATDWRAAVVIRKRQADIVFDSTLLGLASDLPPPLAKSAADSIPFKFERRVTGAQQDRVVVTLGSIVSAQLARRQDGAQTIVERGTVTLGGGSAAEPERKGLWISGGLKSLDLGQWFPLIKSTQAAGNYEIAGLDVKFGTLDMFGRRFHDLAIAGSAQGGVWQATVAGTELVGEVAWRSQAKGNVTARMKSLVIPPKIPGRPAPAPDKDPPELPALDIVAESFQVNQSSLGRLELTAVPDGRDWKLERLRVTNPESTLNIDGVWQGWLTQPRTQVNLRLETSDIGKLLVRLGYPEGIKRGVAKLEGPLSWAGNPSELDYATLSGNLVVEASKGQFVKLDPGIGKLLGVLSLQSLPRRLSLDFRDIFTEGLAFDEIVGTAKVNRGIATTENFRILGPAVRVQMTGDVDLNAETQKLQVKVFPSLSDSLSVAGAFAAGPVAGIAAFVAQKLLKDPLNQLVAYEYFVSGTWADPQVSKIDSGQPQAAEKKEQSK